MRNVAIFVDGGFYLKQHTKFFGKSQPKQVAQNLLTHCLKHIYNPTQDKSNNSLKNTKDSSPYSREEERLYRIFFYDCPPLKKKVHNPLNNKLIDLSKSESAKFRNELHNQLKQTRNLALRLGILDEQNARWKIRDNTREKI